jgi:hypothetical protein
MGPPQPVGASPVRTIRSEKLRVHTASQFSRLCVVVLLLAAGVRAQSKAQERTFPASPADVERALRSLQAYATAKLPTLYGFVTTQEPNLDRYSQGYYQFSITATPRASGETAMQVLAKVTAWYSDDDATKSGYRELVSNGRLELDLLDRLGRSMGIPAPARNESGGSHPSSERAALEPQLTPPASAATASSSAFKTPVTLSESLPKREDLAGLTAKNPDEQRIQQLRRQIASLEEVLRTQSRPTDLAAVRSAGVPVYDQPLQTGKVLFEADAEDEYRVVEELGSWVHVQISGISRGWIERSNLEMPGTNPARGAGLAGSVETGTSIAASHEETSLFPGDWPRLRGRKVKILWIPTSAVSSANGSKWTAARSAFRKGLAGLNADGGEEGIVLVFDSADGGMAAAALPDLQRWIRGELTDETFRRQCWLDPSDAF